ncbi:MAG TPA: hypothetical protein ACFE0H_09770 [Elainellaceae cyanobacterium]
MQTIDQWLAIVVIGCLAVMSPGPNFVITLRNSLTHRQAGVYTAMGLSDALFSCIVYPNHRTAYLLHHASWVWIDGRHE